jgi:hypothetical protein
LRRWLVKWISAIVLMVLIAVMAGLVPAIHVFRIKTWMPGIRVYTWARQRRDPNREPRAR